MQIEGASGNIKTPDDWSDGRLNICSRGREAPSPKHALGCRVVWCRDSTRPPESWRVAVELIHNATLLHDDVSSISRTVVRARGRRVVLKRGVDLPGDWLLIEARCGVFTRRRFRGCWFWLLGPPSTR